MKAFTRVGSLWLAVVLLSVLSSGAELLGSSGAEVLGSLGAEGLGKLRGWGLGAEGLRFGLRLRGGAVEQLDPEDQGAPHFTGPRPGEEEERHYAGGGTDTYDYERGVEGPQDRGVDQYEGRYDYPGEVRGDAALERDRGYHDAEPSYHRSRYDESYRYEEPRDDYGRGGHYIDERSRYDRGPQNGARYDRYDGYDRQETYAGYNEFDRRDYSREGDGRQKWRSDPRSDPYSDPYYDAPRDRDRGGYGRRYPAEGRGGYRSSFRRRGEWEDSRPRDAREAWDKGEESLSLLIRNLDRGTSPGYLQRQCERYGRVTDVYLPRDYHTRKRKSFGFVAFETIEQSKAAMWGLDDRMLDGRRLRVTFAQSNKKDPEEMAKLDDNFRESRKARFGDRNQEASQGFPSKAARYTSGSSEQAPEQQEFMTGSENHTEPGLHEDEANRSSTNLETKSDPLGIADQEQATTTAANQEGLEEVTEPADAAQRVEEGSKGRARRGRRKSVDAKRNPDVDPPLNTTNGTESAAEQARDTEDDTRHGVKAEEPTTAADEADS